MKAKVKIKCLYEFVVDGDSIEDIEDWVYNATPDEIKNESYRQGSQIREVSTVDISENLSPDAEADINIREDECDEW